MSGQPATRGVFVRDGRRYLTAAALAVVGSLLAPAASFADDITPQQIEQLERALADGKTTRDSLQKSLARAEQQAKSLAQMIDKLKSDLTATKSAVESAHKQLEQHAAAVHKYQEEKAQSLVKAATAARARREQAAAALKSTQDKVRDAQDAIAKIKGQKSKAEAQAAEAAKALKAQQNAAAKAKQAADLAARAAADAAAKAQKTQEGIAAAIASAAGATVKLKTAETALATADQIAGKARTGLAEATAEAVQTQRSAEKLLIRLGRLESFSQKIAPILVKRCLACHDAKTAKGRFNVETFSALMRGGESGAEVVPGKSGDSNLVNLVEDGTMPQDADPLTKQEVATIRKWVDTGATLDAGLNPADPLIAIMPSMPQPLPPPAYRVPIPITAAAFSPDGSQLVTSGYHEILIWNPKNGAPVRRITNVAERVYDVEYSPDGRLIAVAAGTPAQIGELKLFRSADGELEADLVRTGDSVFAVAFSPDGKRLAAGGADRSIRVFDVAAKKQQLLIEDHADWVMDVAWLPDSSKLVSASRDKTAKVFDATTGDSLVTFNGHGEPVFGVAVAPDGKTVITSGRDKSLRQWNVSDAKEVRRITGFGDEVFRIFVTRDGRIFSCSADRTARLHSLADGKLLKTFAGHADWVYCIGYNDATKRLATGSFDGEVRVWNVDDGKSLIKFLAAPGYKRSLATASSSRK